MATGSLVTLCYGPNRSTLLMVVKVWVWETAIAITAVIAAAVGGTG
jgi:hypothetical protein